MQSTEILQALDSLADSIDATSPPQFIWMTEDQRHQLTQCVRSQAIGYDNLRTYQRDLATLSAHHGPRLQARLTLAVAERRRRLQRPSLAA